jgi:hypothetical protein
MTIDENGDDVIVGVAKDTPGNSGSSEDWTQWYDCVMRRLEDDTYTRLGRAASHTSTRNYLRPGWAYAWNAFRDFEGEILAYQCKRAGIVERMAYIPSITVDYDSENHGVPSPDGKRFCVPSNWGDASEPMQAYVIDISGLVEASSTTSGYLQLPRNEDADFRLRPNGVWAISQAKTHPKHLSIFNVQGRLYSKGTLHYINESYRLKGKHFTSGVYLMAVNGKDSTRYTSALVLAR